jgi:outer membrane murein-binding lipoprotein Lpp
MPLGRAHPGGGPARLVGPEPSTPSRRVRGAPAVVLGLNRAVGNRATARLLRQGAIAPPAPLTDEQQWEADWNDPALEKYQSYFAGSDRPTGTKKHRYDVLCPLYKAHGIKRPLVYVRDNITTATFFGHKTPAHKDLKTKLKAAEDALKASGVTDAPFTKMWAFNPRTQSGGQWSNHADGKAIDFDEVTNPRLLSASDRRIITALTGIDISAQNPGAATGQDSYDAAAEASKRFKERYSSAGMAQRIGALGGDVTKLEGERDAIQTELDAVPHGKKAAKADKAKAAEILKRLKAKQAELKATAGQRTTLESEKKRYDALDAAIAKLEASTTQLGSEVDALREAAKSGATAKDRASAKRGLKSKEAQLGKDRHALEKKLAARDADTLRGYAGRGFLDLPKTLVEALKAAGLKWGGDYKGAKDFMHFELP